MFPLCATPSATALLRPASIESASDAGSRPWYPEYSQRAQPTRRNTSRPEQPREAARSATEHSLHRTGSSSWDTTSDSH